MVGVLMFRAGGAWVKRRQAWSIRGRTADIRVMRPEGSDLGPRWMNKLDSVEILCEIAFIQGY